MIAQLLTNRLSLHIPLSFLQFMFIISVKKKLSEEIYIFDSEWIRPTYGPIIFVC